MTKTTILFIALLISLVFRTSAQDFLITTKSEFYKVKVLEINQNEIKYKSFNNLNGPIKVLPKKDIRSIKYENGVVEHFETPKESSNIEVNKYTEVNKNEVDYYNLGKQDANKHYNGYTGAGTGTFLTGLLVSPLIGLIPAIATAGTPPAENSLNYPNATLMKNPDYANGYRNTSFAIKKSKVWSNWMITFGISVVAYTIVYNQSQQ